LLDVKDAVNLHGENVVKLILHSCAELVKPQN